LINMYFANIVPYSAYQHLLGLYGFLLKFTGLTNKTF
jgi:hypothetical protein